MVVVGGIGLEDLTQVALAKDHDVIQAFSTDLANQPLRMPILRGRPLFWIAVRLRSKFVPLMARKYKLAPWPYGTKGAKSLRVGTAGHGTLRTIANIC
jgi:hypothetical protein